MVSEPLFWEEKPSFRGAAAHLALGGPDFLNPREQCGHIFRRYLPPSGVEGGAEPQPRRQQRQHSGRRMLGAS